MPVQEDIVINGLLCFISSARYCYAEKDLITVCLTFYNGEKISEAKELLVLSAKEAATRIRGVGKTRAELKDIVDIFRRFDEKDSSLPTFVADCYKSMPPSSGYEVLADHMVTFLSEIAQLRSKTIENIQERQ